MSGERLDQLRAMLLEEPADQFLRYAIALELKRVGNMEQAVLDLEALLREVPQHIPSYYQLALMLADLDRMEEAKETCAAGSLQCLITGDRKARQELLALLNTLNDEQE